MLLFARLLPPPASSCTGRPRATHTTGAVAAAFSCPRFPPSGTGGTEWGEGGGDSLLLISAAAAAAAVASAAVVVD